MSLVGLSLVLTIRNWQHQRIGLSLTLCSTLALSLSQAASLSSFCHGHTHSPLVWSLSLSLTFSMSLLFLFLLQFCSHVLSPFACSCPSDLQAVSLTKANDTDFKSPLFPPPTVPLVDLIFHNHINIQKCNLLGYLLVYFVGYTSNNSSKLLS